MEKKRWSRTGKFVAVVTVVSLVGLVLSFVVFRAGVEKVHKEHLKENIQDAAQMSLMYAKEMINQMVSDLKSAAEAFEDFEDFESFDDPDILKIMKYARDTSQFSFIGLVGQNGQGYDSHGNAIDISDRKYFETAMKGQVAFSEVMESKVFPGEEVQIIAHPVGKGGTKAKGVVYGVLHISDIENLGIQSGKERQASIYIVDSCGSYIAQFRGKGISTSGVGFWTDMEQMSSLNDQQLAELKEAFKKRESGGISYTYDGNERYACYMPLGPNRWQLVYSVSTDPMNSMIHELYLLDTRETVAVSLCYIALMLCVVWYFKRTSDESRRAHQEASKNLEYMRIAIDHSRHIVFEFDQKTQMVHLKTSARNALFVHSTFKLDLQQLLEDHVLEPEGVLALENQIEAIKTDKNAEADFRVFTEGEEIWYRVFLHNLYNEQNEITDTVGLVEDISSQKKREQEMRKRYQLQKTLISNSMTYGVVNLETGTVLEWDEKEVCLPYQETLRTNILENVSESSISYVEQTLSLENLREEYRKGKESLEVQYLKKCEDDVRWVSAVVYRMHMDDSSKVLFVLTDIDAQKRREIKLKEQAERDGLTGLYNAATTRSRINEALSVQHQIGENQVFVLIDLDNYKQINDNFGHSYGDQVLVDIADILNKRFRSSDIVGRIGGDEFVILLRDIKSYEYAEKIIGDLCEQLHLCYQEDGKSVSISASIGMAAAPRDGSSFQELYEKADIAQYQVKKNKKDGFKWYE